MAEKEYIEREAIIKKLREDEECDCELIVLLYDYPAADVAPVKHGRWIPISDGAWAECSECGEACDVSDNGGMTVFELFCDCYKYCPNCGAKMDGGD